MCESFFGDECDVIIYVLGMGQTGMPLNCVFGVKSYIELSVRRIKDFKQTAYNTSV